MTLEFDTRDVERGLNAIAAELDKGFPKAFREIRQEMQQSTDMNFRQQGRPTAWPALSPRTIKARQERAARGKGPRAGLTTIERDQDILRRSLVDSNAPGSASFDSGQEAVVATTVSYAATQQKGNVSRHIPPRPFLLFQNGEEERYGRILQRDMQARVNETVRKI